MQISLSSTESDLGGLAQLGERLHGMQEVIGSTPLSSTLSPYVAMSYDARFGAVFLPGLIPGMV